MHLTKRGSAELTIEKYNRDVTAFASFLNGTPVTKEKAEAWKNTILETHPVKSVNSMISAANSFAAYFGLEIKIQRLTEKKRSLLVLGSNELMKTEFEKLMRAAKESGNERMSLILSTICATGIKISELSNVTMEAVDSGEIDARVYRGRKKEEFQTN